MPSTSTLINKQSLGPPVAIFDRGILRIISHSNIPNKFSFISTFIDELIPRSEERRVGKECSS